jgi:hypothetical protein
MNKHGLILFVCLIFCLGGYCQTGDTKDGLLVSRRPARFVRMNEWGFEIGAKLVTSYGPFLNWNGPWDYQTGTAQLSIGIHDYLFRIRHCRFGMNLYTDGFHFLFERRMGADIPLPNNEYVHVVDMRLNTRNICIGPILDLVCGKHRHSHLYVNPVVGLRIDGTQEIHMAGKNLNYFPPKEISEYSFSTQGLYRWICEVNIGYGRSFRMGKDRRLLIDATFAGLPDQMTLTKSAQAYGITLNPGSIRVTVGVNKRRSKSLRSSASEQRGER